MGLKQLDGLGIVVLVDKFILYRHLWILQWNVWVDCVEWVCIQWICNEWIFNKLWMKFKLPMNFEFNRIKYTNVMNLEF